MREKTQNNITNALQSIHDFFDKFILSSVWMSFFRRRRRCRLIFAFLIVNILLRSFCH